jgi:hypothetical protein
VALAMAREIDTVHPERGPIFWVHLGDLIYDPDKGGLYPNRFYRPNRPYLHPAPGFDGIILAVPGNHDGEVRDAADQPSLAAFLENFCSPPGTNPPLAESFGVVMPNQPGPYWHLDAPFLDLLGLYSNAGEDFGALGAGAADTHQREWLEATLGTLARERAAGRRKALVLALHHPPYAGGLREDCLGHGSSPGMQAELDAISARAGVWPDAVLAGHCHSYQRYLRRCTTADGRELATYYLIAGTAGIKIQPLPEGSGYSRIESPPPPGLAKSEVGYVTGLESYGYLRIAASPTRLQLTFVRAEGHRGHDFEAVAMDLATQQPVFP